MSIAIAIITYNRKEAFFRCCHSMWLNLPDDASVFIVDGGSDGDYSMADYRFPYRATISEVKNKALELCMSVNPEHVFIFEDDCFPIIENWHLPYINSGEHHLCRTFYPTVKTYGNIKTHRLVNGCCMYFTWYCIETVGGFDTNYKNKYEHIDLTRRIHNAGLSNHLYQDVVGSDKLIYCLDEKQEIARSMTNQEMNKSLKEGMDYFSSQRNSKAFIPFR